MKIANNDIKAIILDMDGTIIDSTNVWQQVDIDFFGSRNMECPKTYAEDIAHLGLYDAAIYTKEKYHIKESIDEILQEWNDFAYDYYANKIPLKDNVIPFLKKMKKENIKIALATASPKNLYEPCLKRLKIYEFFDIIVDVDMIKSGKNSPKIYDYIAKYFNLKKSQIAVFEDVVLPLKTAYNNGYIAVGVYDKKSELLDEAKRQYSYLYIKNFKELL